jgi:DNA-binding NarL/FixJ family response regulator
MIRILIADDHAIVRSGIRALLQLHSDFAVVAEAADGREAIAQARTHRPDVALMDIGMSGMDGLTATRELKVAHPDVRVLLLTQHEEPEYVLPALKVGASGYVLKRAPDDSLIQAIRAVHAGETYLDPRISDVLMQDYQSRASGEPPDLLQTLTGREREVLILLAQGRTYQEVADTLFISVKTVEFHRANLMRKLKLENRARLTKFALQHNLIR